MKKIFIIVCIFLSLAATAQINVVPQGNAKTLSSFKGAVSTDYGFIVPVRDTTNHLYASYAGVMCVWGGKLWIKSSTWWIEIGAAYTDPNSTDSASFHSISYVNDSTMTFNRLNGTKDTLVIGGGGSGGGGSSSFNGEREITRTPYEGINLHTTTLASTLEAFLYPSQTPTSGLTITYSATTSSAIQLERMGSGANLSLTLNWSGGRQASTETLSTINVNGTNQSFSQPSAGASVTGTKSESIVRNTNSSFTNTVTTSDGKTSSSTATITFYDNRFWGFVSSSTPTDATIRALSSEFITSRTRSATTSLSPSGSQYFTIGFPESWDASNVSEIWVGGLNQTGAFTRTVRNFVNASGATVSYIFYISNSTTSGDISFEIK